MADSLYSKVNVGSDLFVQLQAGKKVRLRILDYPFVSSQEYVNNGKSTISTKFTWEVYDYETERVRLLSKGSSIFNQIKAIAEEYGEELPMDCDVIISTEGADLSTRYTVVAGRVQKELPEGIDRINIPQKIAGAISLREFASGVRPAVQKKEEDLPVEDYEIPFN